MFEIIKSDLAGRIGVLTTRRGAVETPAFVPVLHPTRQTLPAAKFRELGFEMVITNAYLARRFHGDAAGDVHDMVGFDGPVMTDSGGYQVLEYGDLDVSPREIAEFEVGIGADVAVPLDRPTGYGISVEEARSRVRRTLDVSRATLKESPKNGQIWVGPVQGSDHLDLISASAEELIGCGFQMLALGSPVEFMQAYRYRQLAQMITAARSRIPPSVPLHLFGAGHPLTVPLAVALGCDTFDSASYALYAKQDRYITEDRTRHISEIGYFSCSCEVCANHTPRELREAETTARADLIALHNLHAIKAEVDRTKEAILGGRLWEHVFKKMRSHPRLFEAAEILTASREYLAAGTPRFKKSAVFLFSAEDQFRPEVVRYHGMVRRFTSEHRTLCIFAEGDVKPAYLSAQYASARRMLGEAGVQFCSYNPFLGPMPLEISDIYPAAHHVTSEIERDPGHFTQTMETFKILFERNSFEVTYMPDDAFLKEMLKDVKTEIRRVSDLRALQNHNDEYKKRG